MIVTITYGKRWVEVFWEIGSSDSPRVIATGIGIKAGIESDLACDLAFVDGVVPGRIFQPLANVFATYLHRHPAELALYQSRMKP